jgi:hypothetical protein
MIEFNTILVKYPDLLLKECGQWISIGTLRNLLAGLKMPLGPGLLNNYLYEI